MATGFFAQTDAGEQLFDVNNIVYGLRQSGYMTLVDSWYRWYYRSANLDPNNPSSYAKTAACDKIYGFSVTGAVAPIVFINGVGVFVGAKYVNGVTTFYYMGANANTKFFYFDTMRDEGPIAGMKVFKDDAARTVVFNSAQVPMNIVGAYNAPAPSPPFNGGALPPNWRANIFNGGSLVYYRNTANSADAALLMCRLFVSLPAGNYAVNTTFSRAFSMGKQDTNSPPKPGGQVPTADSNTQGLDGAYGAANGFWWTTCDVPYGYLYWNTTYGVTGFWDVPTDRYPQALVIKIDDLPFPYSSS